MVENGTRICSNVVASQIDIHAEFGGVVPEVAARSHVEVMIPIVEKSLSEAKISWDDVDAIAVTAGPGLIGSLMIGTLTAQTLARLKGKSLLPVNHVEAHIYANFLINHEPEFPLLALIVSGGHTQLVLFSDHGKYDVLGKTRDDAVGEAFDKVAKIIGLPYPGGPSIAKAADSGNERGYAFPKPKFNDNALDFSFSGLKTAVLRSAQTAVGRDFRTHSSEIKALLSQEQRNDIAASFQRTAIEVLTDRLLSAYETHQPKSVVIVGGVAANQLLREVASEKLPIKIDYAPMNLCTDNAAMIASSAYFHWKLNRDEIPKIPDPVLSM